MGSQKLKANLWIAQQRSMKLNFFLSCETLAVTDGQAPNPTQWLAQLERFWYDNEYTWYPKWILYLDLKKLLFFNLFAFSSEDPFQIELHTTSGPTGIYWNKPWKCNQWDF